MKKKNAAALMAAAMAASLLVGCGGGAASSSAAASTAESTPAESTAESTAADTTADGDETLTVWAWDPNFNIYALKQAEAIYQKDHPNFKLNIEENVYSDIETKLITAATSEDYSTLPDPVSYTHLDVYKRQGLPLRTEVFYQRHYGRLCQGLMQPPKSVSKARTAGQLIENVL